MKIFILVSTEWFGRGIQAAIDISEILKLDDEAMASEIHKAVLECTKQARKLKRKKVKGENNPPQSEKAGTEHN